MDVQLMEPSSEIGLSQVSTSTNEKAGQSGRKSVKSGSSYFIHHQGSDNPRYLSSGHLWSVRLGILYENKIGPSNNLSVVSPPSGHRFANVRHLADNFSAMFSREQI